MDTNTLSKHLEKKSLEDISKMVKEIESIIDRYDQEYNISSCNDFFLIKISNIKSTKNEIIIDKSVGKLQFTQLLRNLLKDRYINRLLNKRTEDLLSKVELLD